MISVSYVKNNNAGTLLASDPFLSFENALMQISDEVDREIEIYENACAMYTIESEIMGSIDENAQLYIEAGNKNVFEKIGDAVIAIGKKIAGFISGIIDKIKNIGFKHKSEEEKLKALMDDLKKKDPEKYHSMSKEVVAEFKNGELDFNAIKSIKDMRDAYDEFLELAKKKDSTPDDLQTKLDNIKRKAENADKLAVVKAAGAVGTVVTTGLLFATIKSKLDGAKKTSMDAEKATAEINEKTIRAIREMQDNTNGISTQADRDAVSRNLRKSQIIKNANIYANNEIKDYVGRNMSVIERLIRSIPFINRRIQNETDEFLRNVDRHGQKLARRTQHEENENLRRVQAEEEAKERGRAAQRAATNPNPRPAPRHTPHHTP